MNLDSYKYIYFLGIGGIGMSALARYFHLRGKMVFGYDKEESSLSRELQLEGIDIHYIASVDRIPNVIREANIDDILVIYTPAVPYSNVEIQYFNNKKITLYKRSKILGLISRQFFTIAIAGTHGKTTTSTILAHILQDSGKEITAFLGGVSANYQTNVLLSTHNNILVVEADEYDYSFLELKPDVAIITSVDIDHMDIYNTEEELQSAFIQFSSQIKEEGLLLVEESIDLDFPVPKNGEKRTYSATLNADYYADNIKIRNYEVVFDLLYKDIILDEKIAIQDNITLSLPGIHNVSNCVAAASIGHYLGLNMQDILNSISSFKGIERRFEFIIRNDELVFIDDYAHHPKELTSTIQTVREIFPQRNLTVVFQPHLYSRTLELSKDFAVSLSLADQLILLDIYPAREQPIEGVNSNMLLALCTNPKKDVCKKEELLDTLALRDLDVLLTVGAGDISSLVQPIKYMLN